MSKLTRANFYEALMIGKKAGCEIYYAGSDDIRIRPGWYHVSDGMANYVTTIPTEYSLAGESALSVEWNFILGDKNGNITLLAGTGLVSERPSDTLYSWTEDGGVGFNHQRQGYYSGNKRVLGAIWRASSTSYYIINQLNGSDELGENSNGTWERRGVLQTVVGRNYETGVSVSSAAGEIFYRASQKSVTWPVPFSVAPNSDWTDIEGTTTTGLWLFTGDSAPSTTVSHTFYVASYASKTADFTTRAGATGYWK